MGKKGGKPKIEVTEYFLSQHFGICMGEPDELKAIIIDEKDAWLGSQNLEGDISINKPDLFGGIKKEGGAIGTVRYLPGAPDQVMPNNLAQKLGRSSGADTPAFRGLASIFFSGTSGRGFYWRANSPFLPGVWAKLKRILKRSDGSDQWYRQKAAINSCDPQIISTETRIRLEWLDPLQTVPGNGYYIQGPNAARIDQSDNILASDEATTTRTAYSVEYPDRIEFVWKDPDGPLIANEIDLRLQFSSGGTNPETRARLSILQSGSSSYQTLLPLTQSAVIDPGTPSQNTADGSGFFDVRNLFPDNWFFNVPGSGAGSSIDDDMSITFPYPQPTPTNEATGHGLFVGVSAFRVYLAVPITGETITVDGIGANYATSTQTILFTNQGSNDNASNIQSGEDLDGNGNRRFWETKTVENAFDPSVNASFRQEIIFDDANAVAIYRISVISGDLLEVRTADLSGFNRVTIEFQWGAGPPFATDYVNDYQILNQDGLEVADRAGTILSNGTNLYQRDVLFGGEQDLIGSSSAEITGDNIDMNPAHIIHECLTDRLWGMGTPIAALDDASFRAAADTLFNESFGMSMIWVRQTSIENFVQEVLDHINAVLFSDPSTGLLTLKLIRNDYVEADLPIIDPSNADLSSYSRKLWGDIVNEIIVTWTNPLNEKEETITVQDNASIAIQGGIVSDSRNYYGIRCAELALRIAYRDLRTAGQPLASIKATVDRSQYAVRPGSVLKVTWPEYGLVELIMRVTAVDYGKPGEPEIELDLVEDVFGLDVGSFDVPASSAWIDPSADPEPFGQEIIFTLPAFFAISSVVGEFVDSPEYPEVVAGIITISDNSDAYAYELWDEVTLADGSLEWQRISENNVIGSATLAADLPAEASSGNISLDGLIGATSPQVGGFAIIGDGTEATDEIVLITGDDGDFDLSRGVLDTVPRAWPAGTRVFFINDDTLYEDPLIRSGGELVDYRALMKTSQGKLAFEDATTFSATLSERPWLPNRPADVKAEGIAFSSENNVIDAGSRPDPWVTVSWAIRNRDDEDLVVLGWEAASATPEAGQTTTIEVRASDDTLLTTHDGLTGTSFDVPDASFGSEEIVRLRIYSERSDGLGDLESLQYFEHWIRVIGTARRTHNGIDRQTHSGDTRLITEN